MASSSMDRIQEVYDRALCDKSKNKLTAERKSTTKRDELQTIRQKIKDHEVDPDITFFIEM